MTEIISIRMSVLILQKFSVSTILGKNWWWYTGPVSICCKIAIDFNKAQSFIKHLLSTNQIMKHKIILFPFSSSFYLVFDSLPPAHYKETMSTILVWIQQSETKLSMPQVAVAEYEIMEQRLRELKVSAQAVGTNASN